MASLFPTNILRATLSWVKHKLCQNYQIFQQDQEAMIPEKKFHLAIQRECARADRNGNGFSLVIFDIGEAGEQGETAQQLIDVLQRRLRLTDEAGWFGKRYVGVILYGTPLKEGAWRFANDVWDMMSEYTEEPPQCTVYSYPSDWRHVEVDTSPAQFKQRKMDKQKKTI